MTAKRYKRSLFELLRKWFKSKTNDFDKPLSNSTQRLSAWAGILTGVVSLVISVVALFLSIQQAKDHKQIDALTGMVTRLDTQIMATNKLNILTIDQNKELGMQSEIMFRQSKELVRQVEYTVKLFKLSQSDAETRRKSAASKLDYALTTIFYQMTNTCELYEDHLLKNELELSDTIYVERLDEFGVRIQKSLEEINFNSIVINNGQSKSILDIYTEQLKCFDKNSYKLKMDGKTHFAFIEKSRNERAEFINDYRAACLFFFNHFENNTNTFPLKSYLLNHLTRKD